MKHRLPPEDLVQMARRYANSGVRVIESMDMQDMRRTYVVSLRDYDKLDRQTELHRAWIVGLSFALVVAFVLWVLAMFGGSN